MTVDMIATGTDVKPLECVFFMRDVRSAQYFEQMKGRGARTITSADFQAVTPDAENKTRFVIVDAIGVTEHPFVEPPLNRQKSVSLKKLLDKAAALTLTEDEAATLASRLAKLELALTDEERRELDEVAGQPVRDIVRALVDSVDPSTGRPNAIERAIEPIAANPELRNRILELRAAHDRVIDEVSSRRTCRSRGSGRHGSRPVDRGVVAGLPRRASRRNHRDSGRCTRPVSSRIDFAYIQGARCPHRSAAAQLDARHHLERLRRDRRAQGAELCHAHPHGSRSTDPLHHRRRRRTRSLR